MKRRPTVHLWLVIACAGLMLAACSDDAKKKPVGDPCENNTDCEDEICHVGVCASKAPSKVGATCTFDAECRSFNCVNGVCAPGSGGIGDPCRSGDECASGVCTVEGTFPGLCAKDSNPDAAVPDSAPDAGADQALPDTALPDTALPDTALPDTALPDTALPDTALPDMPTPDLGPCGNKNEPCCGGLCNGTLACISNTCVCGAKDQPCCSGSICDANLTCLSSTTNLCACGALKQACCGGTTCSGALFCAGKACACIKVMESSFYIRTDGTIWYTNYSSTKAIGGLSGMTEVMAPGYYHACGLKSDGTVWCWSRNTYYGNLMGQLGNGTFVTPPTVDIPSQVKVSASAFLTGVTNISGTGGWGGYNATTCAVKSDKTVWCWGKDKGSLFQQATASDKAYATQIKASATSMLTGATQVGLNHRHACAVVGSGSLACWGHNGYGQLGAGDSTARQYPVMVSISGKTVKRVSVGADVSCALTTTGEVYCWGRNNVGQCGQGYSSVAVATPMQVAQKGGGKLTGVKAIAAGDEMACAVKTDGSLWCWGRWPLPQKNSATQMTDMSSALINDAVMVTTVHHSFAVLRTNGEFYVGSSGAVTYSCP